MVNLKGFSLLTKMMNFKGTKRFKILPSLEAPLLSLSNREKSERSTKLKHKICHDLFSVIVNAKPGALTTHPDAD